MRVEAFVEASVDASVEVTSAASFTTSVKASEDGSFHIFHGSFPEVSTEA